MDIKIIVATHKKYWMPDDPMYLPVHVGSAGKESIGYQRDDEGENITPASNIINSFGGSYETILNAEQAADFTYEKMFSQNTEK